MSDSNDLDDIAGLGVPVDQENWDPNPLKRSYYRDANTSELGWVVRRNGFTKIKLDRPGDREIIRPFNKHQWVTCEEHRPLTPYQVGEMAFEADRVLCRAFGRYQEANREWKNMHRSKQLRWVEEGPKDDPVRAKLYRIIKIAMAGAEVT